MAGTPLKSHIPEILAPAGDPLKLRTALIYGADAVYLAGSRFGLRQASDNFQEEELRDACRYAHDRGKKVYLALNAFLFDHELQGVPSYVAQCEKMGVDALIVSDLGVLRIAREHSSLPLHISTQASTLNSLSAGFWKDMGAKRVVLGREVSMEEAIVIRKKTGIEVEVFVHGAMCMSYSGHCTISNYTAGRDSNRGGCIQSCRFAYHLNAEKSCESKKATTFLSSKDLRAMPLMNELLGSPIDSLKIEGRNKSLLYVATAVRNYSKAKRQFLKQGRVQKEELMEDLERMSFRGYTEANLKEKAGSSSVYEYETSRTSGYCMLGYVVEKVQGQYAAILLRSGFQDSDQMEIMGVGEVDYKLPKGEIRDSLGQKIKSGRPNTVIYIPDSDSIEEGMVLRKRGVS
ncbi:MAG: peptidase U32 [Acidobacteria bacterium]|nr:MAG: peptidase U32 [Acidobacteriota bacterium]PIE89725.1 MAG: peptidase U32 [Acidobacteriota bacterium]